MREQQEKEDRKSNEKIRRKTGQELTQAKEKMEDEQLKKAFEAKKKEKEADRLAKAKIKAQIEADKKERAAKVLGCYKQVKVNWKRILIFCHIQRDAAKQVTQAQAAAASAEAAAAPKVKKEYTDSRLQVWTWRDLCLSRTMEFLQNVFSYIQIRLPGGAPITHTFPATSQLEDVASFIRDNGHAQTFTLSTSFPR